MSGVSCLIFMIASRPSSASVQAHPVCSSTNLRSPDRTGTLSSAISTCINWSVSRNQACHSSCSQSIRVIDAIDLLKASIRSASDVLNARFAWNSPTVFSSHCRSTR